MNLINRREALKKLQALVVAAGIGSLFSMDDLEAVVNNPENSPKVIWLHGTSCSGCTMSFLNMEAVSVTDFITTIADVVYHPDLSAATGHQAIAVLKELATSNQKFIFIFEGGIPVKMPHSCLMDGKPMADWVEALSARAAVSVAVGSCASFGGVTRMKNMPTGNMTLSEFYQYKQIKTPVINLPNCPVKPEHVVYTLLYYRRFNRLPERDLQNRPVRFYLKTVHERCIYYRDFQEDNFAEFIGDEGCLIRLGCQGPVTHNDCMIIGNNHNTNTCIKAGHPCVGCAGERFPRKIMYHRYNDPRSLEIKI